MDRTRGQRYSAPSRKILSPSTRAIPSRPSATAKPFPMGRSYDARRVSLGRRSRASSRVPGTQARGALPLTSKKLLARTGAPRPRPHAHRGRRGTRRAETARKRRPRRRHASAAEPRSGTRSGPDRKLVLVYVVARPSTTARFGPVEDGVVRGSVVEESKERKPRRRAENPTTAARSNCS